MNRNELLDLIGEAQDKYILAAMQSKNQTTRKKLSGKRMFLIAAVVTLSLLLVGCGIVYLLKMEDLKLEDREWTDPYVSTGEPVSQRILTTGGIQGTVNYQAAKEWHDFEAPYAKRHDWDESFPCPPEYQGYHLYSQEMVEKLEEILTKHQLKPLGPEIVGESDKGLLTYLGIDHVLLPEAPAKATDLGAKYFENGHLTLDCCIQMEPGEGRWTYPAYIRYFTNPKDCFGGSVFVLDDPEKWEEWNYTTPSGDSFLVLYSPDYWEAYAICDEEDRTICMIIQTAKEIYTDFQFSEELMSRDQVEDLLDVMDFSVKPQPSDPALLSGLPADYDTISRIQTLNGYTVKLESAVSDGNMAWVTVTAEVPENTDSDNRVSFRRQEVSLRDVQTYPHVSGTYLETGELVLCWYDLDSLEGFTEGAEYSLTLEDMHPAVAQGENGYPWECSGVWKFDFTFDAGCDFRKLEFVSQPTELPAGENGKNLTVTGIFLHSRSAVIQLEEALNSWKLDLTVILKDGTAIPLQGHSGSALNRENTRCIENYVSDTVISLDEVDHILLSDGTRLFPVTNP